MTTEFLELVKPPEKDQQTLNGTDATTDVYEEFEPTVGANFILTSRKLLKRRKTTTQAMTTRKRLKRRRTTAMATDEKTTDL